MIIEGSKEKKIQLFRLVFSTCLIHPMAPNQPPISEMISHSFIDADGGVFLCVSEVRPVTQRRIDGLGVEKRPKMGWLKGLDGYR